MGKLKIVVIALIVIGVVFTFAYRPTLTITASAGGTTNPSPGTHTFYWFLSPTITAIPENGWVFSHWELDDGSTSTLNPIKIRMTSSHALRAVFEGGGDGGD